MLALALMANLAFEQSLGRGLDISLDLYLIDAVYRLAVGNLGRTSTWLLLVAILGVVGASIAGLGWLLAPSHVDGHQAGGLRRRRLGTAVAGTGLCLGLLGAAVPPLYTRAPAPALSFIWIQAAELRARRLEREAFAGDLEAQPTLPDSSALLRRLGGHSVVLGYLESYGTVALEDPQFLAVVRPLLEGAQSRFDSAGIHMVTGRLVSPTLGGQSWYAHGTMLSGLWLENQLRYELLLASARSTLVDDFRRAGYRTATVMPAITTAWPEAVRIGYDDVYTSQNMGYAGPPFYWVAMPDQFTWSFIGGLLRDANAPVFIESGMVSSHAPWTPIIPLVDWSTIGDGSVFGRHRVVGEPPDDVWWDVGALRAGYALSIAYSLEAMVQFAERYLDDRTLLIVAGDHQAAPWVTGSSAFDVPVHVLSRDGAVLEPFTELGFVQGAFPDASWPAHRMDEFRVWFLDAYSESVAPRS